MFLACCRLSPSFRVALFIFYFIFTLTLLVTRWSHTPPHNRGKLMYMIHSVGSSTRGSSCGQDISSRNSRKFSLRRERLISTSPFSFSSIHCNAGTVPQISGPISKTTLEEKRNLRRKPYLWHVRVAKQSARTTPRLSLLDLEVQTCGTTH